MLKRLLDILVSFFVLLIASPVLLVFMFLVWIQDKHSPFYVAPRVAKGGGTFKMVKLRSMVVNADKSGVSSTSDQDNRITGVGKLIRKYKLDEITQFWNVLLGDMSLVGPRPQVQYGVDLYTDEERRLLTVRPGVTDIASIVFSDEGEILKDSKDPDHDYDVLIRPWKSRLGLFYVDHSSLLVDIKLLFLTANAILSKESALIRICALLKSMGAPEEYVRIASRKEPLVPTPPPGSDSVVASRTGGI